jgi:hypothetical protein
MADVTTTSGFDLNTDAGTGVNVDNIPGVNLRVSASGGSIEALGQQLAASSIPVVLASDVSIDTELPAAAALTDNFANPTAPAVGAFGMVWDGATWDRMPGNSTDGVLVNLGANNDVTTEFATNTAPAALTDNFANPTAMPIGAFGMLWDGATWDRAPGDSTDGALVNLGANNDVTTEFSTNTAPASLSDAFANPTAMPVGAFGMVWDGSTDWNRLTSSLTAAMADDVTNPTVTHFGSMLMGWDSTNTNWNRIEVDDAGHLQVDILSGGGSDPLTNGVISGGNATTPVNATDSGGTATLNTPDAAATGPRLFQMCVWTSVAYKVLLYKVENGTQATDPFAVGGGQAYQPFVYEPPHPTFVTLSTTGVNQFRAIVTNLDNKDAADVYMTAMYAD